MLAKKKGDKGADTDDKPTMGLAFYKARIINININ